MKQSARCSRVSWGSKYPNGRIPQNPKLAILTLAPVAPPVLRAPCLSPPAFSLFSLALLRLWAWPHQQGPTSSFDTSQHPHNHSHRPSPSAEGSAWNQLSQHADASGTVQGGHNGSIERCDDPAGGVRLSPALSSSSAFRHTPDFGSVRGSGGGNGVEGEMETKISPGSVAQQQQQSSAVMPPPRSSMSMSMSMSMLSTFGSHHHLHNQHAALAAATHTGGGGAEVGIGGGGGGGGSNMPSLRDLLLDKPAQAQGGPTDGDLSMVV